MSFVIGRGRYARATYPENRSAASLAVGITAAWDRLGGEEEELQFQNDGSAVFRHPRIADQVTPEFLQTVWAPGRISAGDTLFIDYSGEWEFDAADEGAGVVGASVLLWALISVDNGVTWLIDGEGTSSINMADNVADDGVSSRDAFARTWVVTVPALANPVQNVIVGVALSVQTPITAGSPSITMEGDEGGARLAVTRWNPSLIVDAAVDTTWAPAVIVSPPWRP